MKPLFITLLLIVTSVPAQAEAMNVTFHLDEPLKVSALINSINNLRDTSPAADIYAVITGKAIIRFSKQSSLVKKIAQLTQQKVKVGVCNNAVLANKITSDDLLPGIIILSEGGITKMIELQQQGYAYIMI
mgnify:CR=1 FL=1